MTKAYKIPTQTNSIKFLNVLNISLYFCGFTDFWVIPVNLPRKFIKFYDKIIACNHLNLIILMISMHLSFFTQPKDNLTMIQEMDRTSCAITMPFMYFYYYNFIYYRVKIKDILYKLVVVLKEVFNDREIEDIMIKKNIQYNVSFFLFAGGIVLSRGVLSFVKMLLFGDPFIPFVSAWPTMYDRYDQSTIGALVRILNYIAIWFYMLRCHGVFTLIGLLFITLFCQFKNLQKYFYRLNNIFLDDRLSWREKEKKYEAGFKKGIYLHCITISCIKEFQFVGRPMFSVQLILSFSHLMSLIPNFVMHDPNKEMAQILTLPMLMIVLIMLAYFMLNAGDITVEASKLPNAMFASGWHHCCGNIATIRKLLVNGITVAQRPVMMKAFDIIELSYENFVTIVKTTYSVFSVFH